MCFILTILYYYRRIRDRLLGERDIKMSTQLMFSIDLNRCINCKTCEMACIDYHGFKDIHRRHVVTFQNSDHDSIHLSISCNHCENPICVTICPENNFIKRRDGIVIHQANHCRGCERCINACPFHAPKLNPIMNRVDKCNFCYERIDQGLKPICVENCITNGLSVIAVNRDELKPYGFNEANIPIMGYTNPSIYIIKKHKSNTHKEG
ncbi:4Fe-4S dicluster domain-containing protein [Bacillus sp. HMF5848]|uniref:4Fe-4S dicluster domain-containing protein n=1 Tax=Bacillus sp. HMF5848 TaxID=2495421 RepID=UPI000F7995A0|nr:4Fe-4S dicluster domain-containing protein [Bacillus sp. HMF5848]